jgi:uncharacterized protein involved in exopolysaccharide biosynthesis
MPGGTGIEVQVIQQPDKNPERNQSVGLLLVAVVVVVGILLGLFASYESKWLQQPPSPSLSSSFSRSQT